MRDLRDLVLAALAVSLAVFLLRCALILIGGWIGFNLDGLLGGVQ